MRITWVSNHKEGLLAFQSVLNTKDEVNAFVTLTDTSFVKRSGGTRKFKKLCFEHNIPYYEVDTIKGDEAYEIIKTAKPDLLVVLGWSEILPERLLLIPTIGTIGTHAAMLPHNRGSAPINWALIKNEKTTGNTMMWLNPEVDSGAIIDQIPFDIDIYDTCGTLYDKVAKTNRTMILHLLEELNKGNKPVLNVKNETDEELLPRRRPKDGLINWDSEGIDLYNFIRAVTKPYPGAFSFLNGQQVVIWDVALLPFDSRKNSIKPGEIFDNTYSFSKSNNGFVVGTKTNALLITRITIDGKEYYGKKINGLNLKGVFANE